MKNMSTNPNFNTWILYIETLKTYVKLGFLITFRESIIFPFSMEVSND